MATLKNCPIHGLKFAQMYLANMFCTACRKFVDTPANGKTA